MLHPLTQKIAEEVLAIQAHYAEKGMSMAQVALAGADEFVEFRHYPKNDLVDVDSGYEMYYHAHPLRQEEGLQNLEHGHFHLFKRDEHASEKFTHLVAIALNQQGLPIKLFTTNGWVTGESMQEAKRIKPLLAQFEINAKGRMAPLAKWVGGLVQLFQSEMHELLKLRDQRIQILVAKNKSRPKVLEDQNHHVLSEVRVDLLNKLESLVG